MAGDDGYDLGDLAGTLFKSGSDQFGLGGFDLSGLTDIGSKAASGGWWDTLKGWGSDFGSLAKNILPAAQVGAAGYGIYSGMQGANQLAAQTKIAEQAAKRQGDISRDTSAFGQEQLARAQAGTIPPAVQAQIDQWAKGAKQQAQDQAARTGQGDSTQLKQWLAWIDQQAQAMQASYLQQETQTGLTAEQIAMGASGASGSGASQQQGSLEQLIAQSNQVLARLSQGAS